jgi:hypothetical protein
MVARMPSTAWVIVVFVGSFGTTWVFTAMGVAWLVALGVDYHEAEVALMLLAFLVFLPLFLWSFASPRQGRVMVLLFGGAALMTSAAWAIQRAVLA